MEGNKKWYKSKGVWGGIIAVCAGLAGSAFGVEIGPEAQDQLANHLPALAGAIGGVVAVIGRLTAKDKTE